MLEYFMAIWNILLPVGIVFYGHFGTLVVNWYIFLRFGILYHDKSGNPAALCYFFVLLDRHNFRKIIEGKILILITTLTP
jgi:hypothetical protein